MTGAGLRARVKDVEGGALEELACLTMCQSEPSKILLPLGRRPGVSVEACDLGCQLRDSVSCGLQSLCRAVTGMPTASCSYRTIVMRRCPMGRIAHLR